MFLHLRRSMLLARVGAMSLGDEQRKDKTKGSVYASAYGTA